MSKNGIQEYSNNIWKWQPNHQPEMYFFHPFTHQPPGHFGRAGAGHLPYHQKGGAQPEPGPQMAGMRGKHPMIAMVFLGLQEFQQLEKTMFFFVRISAC